MPTSEQTLQQRIESGVAAAWAARGKKITAKARQTNEGVKVDHEVGPGEIDPDYLKAWAEGIASAVIATLRDAEVDVDVSIPSGGTAGKGRGKII